MNTIFVTCGNGLEDLLTQELIALGLPHTHPGFRGVYIPKSIPAMYTVNYLSRIATRVLWPLIEFVAQTPEDLYKQIIQFPWEDWIDPKETFAIDANVQHKNFKNSLYAAQVAKDAICDRIRDKKGKRPSIDTHAPDIQLNLFLSEARAVFSFDTSGEPLFKRGYRLETVEAPMQESLAAALLQAAGYSSKEIFCDPFCGSGTILIEALMIQKKIPAGFFRKKFGFMKMCRFDASSWAAFLEKHRPDLSLPLDQLVIGNDKDPKATHACLKNLQGIHLENGAVLSTKDIGGFFPSVLPTLVISNPPYGIRLDLSQRLFADLSVFLKQRCSKNVRAFVLTNTPEALHNNHLKILSSKPFVNGGVDVELFEVVPI